MARTAVSGEFVNWAGEVPSFASISTTKDALIVGLPVDGDLLHIATLTEWEAEGHVKSIGAAIRQWRQTRRTIRQDARSSYSGGSAMMYSSATMFRGYSGGGMMRGGGGG